jgi:ariadne-1
LGPWSEHGSQFYSCNRYEEKTSIDARDQQSKSRAALERYLHFYNRYANHQQSAKLDKELYEKTEKKMEEMQRSSDLSWIEVQYLRKAVEVLLKSRSTLMWTYAFAYYLAKNNATVLFEDNQRDLEMAVNLNN